MCRPQSSAYLRATLARPTSAITSGPSRTIDGCDLLAERPPDPVRRQTRAATSTQAARRLHHYGTWSRPLDCFRRGCLFAPTLASRAIPATLVGSGAPRAPSACLLDQQACCPPSCRPVCCAQLSPLMILDGRSAPNWPQLERLARTPRLVLSHAHVVRRY